MDSEAVLAELLDLAEKLGIEVRRELLGGDGGGLCLLRGRRVLFVDTGADLVEQVGRTVAAPADLWKTFDALDLKHFNSSGEKTKRKTSTRKK